MLEDSNEGRVLEHVSGLNQKLQEAYFSHHTVVITKIFCSVLILPVPFIASILIFFLLEGLLVPTTENLVHTLFSVLFGSCVVILRHLMQLCSVAYFQMGLKR